MLIRGKARVTKDLTCAMCIEFEVRIEGHSQCTWVPFQGQYGITQSDLGMDARLR